MNHYPGSSARVSAAPSKLYVLGVDGGGSRSLLSVYDLDGDHIFSLPGGSLNHEGLPHGFADVRNRLRSMIDTLAEATGITPKQVRVSTFGIAGIDTPRQEAELLALVRGLGFTRSIVCNDAFLGIHALPFSRCTSEFCGDVGGSSPNSRQVVYSWGICSIQGTGCTTVGIDRSGRKYRLGGFGPFSRDMGGGYNLTWLLMAAIYDAEFRGGPATIMRDLVYQRLGISDRDEFIETTITGLNHSKRCSPLSLNSIVFEAARESDPVASQILISLGNSIAGDIARILQAWSPVADAHIPVVLAGSLHTKERENVGILALRDKVVKECPKVRIEFHYLEQSPVIGAVALSLAEAGYPESVAKIHGGPRSSDTLTDSSSESL